MSKLTSNQRNKIPSKEFGIPSERKYPLENRSHAANAKARASQQYNKGHISLKMLHDIDSKADRILSHKK